MYYRHSGFKGHLKETNLKDLMIKDANEVLRLAVKGMLPKNKLRDPKIKRLKLFTDATHHYKVATQDLVIA
jgi:large subunit ribosomal protein L13